MPLLGASAGLIIPPVGITYTDDFNRADGDPGANWVQRTTGAGVNPVISSNHLGITWGSAWHISTYVSDLLTDDEEISCTTVGASIGVRLWLRSNDSQQIIASTFANLAAIYTMAGTFAAQANAVARGTNTAMSPAAGSSLVFRAQGPVYTFLINGAEVAKWTDTGFAAYPYVNSSHRKFGVGLWSTATTNGIDDLVAKDI
jgi:hypothetical protein